MDQDYNNEHIIPPTPDIQDTTEFEPDHDAPTSDAEDGWPWPMFPRNAKRNYIREYRDRFTGWEGDFLEAFRNSGVVRAACFTAKIPPSLVLRRRKVDSMFNLAYKQAQEDALDTMEAAAYQRAVTGVTRNKPIYYKGKILGYEKITEYSDSLLTFLLKAGRPQKFRDTITHDHQIKVLEEEARRLAEKQGVDADRVVEEAKRIMGFS